MNKAGLERTDGLSRVELDRDLTFNRGTLHYRRILILPALFLMVALAAAAAVSADSGIVLEIDTERDITINGIDTGDDSAQVETGDLNNDGFADLIIGVAFGDPGGRDGAGETHIVFGPLQAGTFELTSTASTTVNGIDAGDGSGVSVASGDLNGDAIDDLIVGADHAGPGGETYVIFGPLGPTGTPLELATEADITFSGIDTEDRAGVGVTSGDLNNDGVADLVIGAYFGDPGGRNNAGETYVIFGPLDATSTPLDLSTSADITLNGIDADDISGARLASGDINNDGKDDLIIGAAWADPAGRTDAGETYVVFGPIGAGVLELAGVADITLSGIVDFDFVGLGVGSGDVNNDGKDDLLIGARFADTGAGNDAGETYVLFGPLTAGVLERTGPIRAGVSMPGRPTSYSVLWEQGHWRLQPRLI